MAGPGSDRSYVPYDFRAELEAAGKLPRRAKRRRQRREPQRHHDARPNVLWLMADQWRGDMLGFLGHHAVRTPTLDRLAEEGVAFTRAYCSSPVCLPSRASMLSGQPLPVHGALVNGMAMRDEVVTFPELLREAGYRTANLGKHHCGRAAAACWEHRDNVLDAFGATKPSDVPFDPAVYPECVFIADEVCDNSDRVLYGTYPGPVPTTKSHRLATKAMQWLYYHDDPRPFFLRVSFDDPHPPVVPPEPFASMYGPDDVPDELLASLRQGLDGCGETLQRYAEGKGYTRISEAQHRLHAARYMGLCSHLDAQLGRILAALDEYGFRDETLVVFNSDHGHLIGERGFSHKHYLLYEGVNRVPLIARWPGHLPAGQRRDALVDGCDVAATFLDALDVPAPDMTGRSVLGVARGESERLHDHIVVQYDDFCWSILDEAGHKLIRYDTDPDGVGELYLLSEDPYEHRNRWHDPALAATRDALLEALAAWRRRFGAEVPA